MSRIIGRKAWAAAAMLPLLALACGRGNRSGAGEGANLAVEITAEHPVPSPGAEDLAQPPSSP